MFLNHILNFFLITRLNSRLNTYNPIKWKEPARGTQSIAETVYRVTKKAQKEEGLPVLFSGGVSASSQLQRRFEGKDQVAFAQNGWGGDNALGAALLAAMWKEGVL